MQNKEPQASTELVPVLPVILDIPPSILDSTKNKTRYEVLQKLGEGGMGVVELVRDHLLGREVARKTLRFKQSSFKQKKIQSQNLWRLKKEASITAILEHPNIIPLYEMQENEANGELQFTMRKVEGETFRTFLQKIRTGEIVYEETKLLNIFRKVCDGVSYAHAKGVVHRDLKPENIMIGQFGEVYVMDWGIAKRLQRTPEEEQKRPLSEEVEIASYHTIGGIGTPGYMAPEQQKNASTVTPQADIYALGRILKECFTLQSPLEELKHRLDELTSVKNLKKWTFEENFSSRKLSEEIEAITQKSTHEKREERYQTVQELMVDIDRYQKNLKLSIKEYGVWETITKWSKRNKAKLAIFGLLLTVSLTVAGYYQWKNYKERETECNRLRQAIRKAQEKTEALPEIENKQEQEERIHYLLEGFNAVEDALTLKPEAQEFEKQKEVLGKELIQRACGSQDYRLARYISERLKDLTLLTKQEKDYWPNYVTTERDKQLKTNQETLKQWMNKAKPKKSGEANWKSLEAGEVQDFIFEVSQMKEPEIFAQLMEEFEEGVAFFKETQSEFRGTKQEEYYLYITEILGRLGNQKACKPILSAMNNLYQYLSQSPKFPQEVPFRELEWMIGLAQALGNLKNQECAASLNQIRQKMGETSLFGIRSKRSIKKLIDGLLIHFVKLVQQNPFDPEAYQNLGNVKQLKGDLEGAIAEYTEAIHLNPQAVLAYHSRGMAKHLKNDLEGAIDDYTKAIQQNPQFFEAYNNRGNAKRVKKLFEEAIDDFTEAIRLNPQFSNAYNNRGMIKKLKGEMSSAMDDFTEAIRLNPQFSNAYNNRGIIKQHQRDWEGAMMDFTEAIRLDPQDASVYNSRASVKQSQGNLEGALVDYTEAIHLNPQYSFAYHNRGICKQMKGDFDGAMNDYNETIRLDPQDINNTYNTRGVTKLARGDLHGAIADYQEAIRLHPQNAPAYFNRGFAYQKLGMIEKGIESLECGLQIEPDPEANQFLLELLQEEAVKAYRKKNYAQAKTYFLKFKQYASENDPKLPQIKNALQQLETLLLQKK